MASNPEKINAARLAKSVPGLSDRLVNAQSKEEAGNIMKEVADEFYDVVDRQRLKENAQEALLTRMSQLAAPGSQPAHIALQQRFKRYMEILGQLKVQRQLLAGKVPSKPTESERYASLHDDFLVAARKNRQDIASTCFSGDVDAQEAHCATYEAMSASDFFEVLWDDLRKGLVDIPEKELFVDRIEMALEDVQMGLHEPKTICWNCGNKKAKLHCTRCQAAIYCNKACQLAHYKRYHGKAICKMIKKMYQNFLEGRNAVVLAFTDPETHEKKYGFKPSIRDMALLTGEASLTFGQSFEAEEAERGTDGPNMVCFYRNVQHVIHNGFWTSPGPPETITPKKVGYTDQFMLFSIALMYDYSDEDGSPRTEWFCSRLQHVMDSCRQVEDTSDLDPKILHGPLDLTAEEWLYAYRNGDSSFPISDGFKKPHVGHLRLLESMELKFNKKLRELGADEVFVALCHMRREVKKDMSWCP